MKHELKWNEGLNEEEKDFDSKESALLYFNDFIARDDKFSKVHLCGSDGCSIQKLKV